MASNDEISVKGVWYWQSNTNPFSETEEKQWTQYNDFENELIEVVYLKKDDKVSLNKNYYISLKRMLQVSTHDKNKQRPIKRENIQIQEEPQFQGEDQPVSSRNPLFGAPGEKPYFINEWVRRNNIDSHYLNEENAEEIVLEAAKGIEEEGKLLQKESEGTHLSNLLKESKKCGLLKLSETCIYMYTLESFVYKEVNNCLRLDDMSKITTLGPFCFLLYNALWLLRSNGKITLYRAVPMSEEMLDSFTANIGKQQSWKAFTSASRNRGKAEKFGNALFIISVVQMPFKPAYWTDVSKYSEYSEEEEVILPAAVTCMINKVEYDRQSGKHRIYLANTTEDQKGECRCEKPGDIFAHPHVLGLAIHNATCREVARLQSRLHTCTS